MNISFCYGCPTSFLIVFCSPLATLLGPIILSKKKLSPKKYKHFCRNEPEMNISFFQLFVCTFLIYLIYCIKIHQETCVNICCCQKIKFYLIPAHRPFFEPELNISVFLKNFDFLMLYHHFLTKYLLECAF